MKCSRVDVVFYVYRKDMMKSEARLRRGTGVRRRVTENSKTPNNWKCFLRDDDNKAELFALSVDKMTESDRV